jgi:alkylation response protein AidB-like acyl-CoA dehydrogenase
VGKLFWSHWRQALGELEMDLLGSESMLELQDELKKQMQYTFLFSRAETIYAGSSEVQRNIISERVLGLPKGPT